MNGLYTRAIPDEWGNVLFKRKPLSYSDERLIALMIERGGPAKERAIEILVEANIAFAASEALKWRHYSDFDGIFSVAMLGLFDAAQRFKIVQRDGEPTPVKFISFARWHIISRMQRHVAQMARPVAVPDSLISKISVIKGLVSRFKEEHGTAPSGDELYKTIRERYTEDDGHLSTAFSMFYAKYISLDYANKDDNGEARSLHEYFMGDCDTDKKTIDNERGCVVRSLLDQYLECSKERGWNKAERNYDIIKRRFGIDYEPQNLREIGDHYGISREMVRQVEKRFITDVRTLPRFAWAREEFGNVDVPR